MNILLGLVVLLGISQWAEGSRVYELSDRFLDIYQEGTWLVKFYAPWCGHCKKLEPVWMQVAQQLSAGEIRVGRVDCTKYSSVASHFGIRGYPTIKFLRGSELEDTYEGDREREHIVEYALRMNAPVVTPLADPASLRAITKKHLVFFVFAGERSGPLWAAYEQLAHKFRAHHYFYSCAVTVLGKQVRRVADPTVAVWKDDRFRLFEQEQQQHLLDSAHQANDSLHQFVNVQRFTRFMKVTAGNLGQLLNTGRLLVIAVAEEDPVRRVSAADQQFRDMLHTVATHTMDRFPCGEVQFGWVAQPSLVNGVVARTLSTPSLVVINASDYTHYLPDDQTAQLTEQAVTLFLDEIRAGSLQAGGGDSYPMRVYRAVYQARTSIEGMWRGNPILTSLLFGLPAGFLSLICYSICCQDIMDADDDDEDYAYHEKRE